MLWTFHGDDNLDSTQNLRYIIKLNIKVSLGQRNVESDVTHMKHS